LYSVFIFQNNKTQFLLKPASQRSLVCALPSF